MAAIRAKMIMKTAKKIKAMMAQERDKHKRDKLQAKLTSLACSLSTIGIDISLKDSILIKLSAKE
jgi:hypothetical protein